MSLVIDPTQLNKEQQELLRKLFVKPEQRIFVKAADFTKWIFENRPRKEKETDEDFIERVKFELWYNLFGMDDEFYIAILKGR